MQVVVDGLLTSYSLHGSGKKTALFLHGWADSARTYDSLIKEFLKENPRYSVLVLDLPGFGSTEIPTEAWGLSEYAQFVQTFLHKIKKQSDLIVGHSNGGAIAILGLSQGILKAEGLILVASAGVRLPSKKNAVYKIVSVPLKAALAIMPNDLSRKIKGKAYQAIGSDYMISEHMQETFKKVVAQDVTEEARLVSIPTCLIYGEKDTATPPVYGEQLHVALKESRLHIIPEATHFVHQEQVYKVAHLMTEFIAEL